MKKNYSLLILGLVCLLLGFVNSCKKDPLENATSGIETSFTEEFADVRKLLSTGWTMTDNSVADNPGNNAAWIQGEYGTDKGGGWFGFYAYSYTNSPDEFVYSPITSPSMTYSISSWLISPTLSVKNGDQISFYSRADSTGDFTERMQVLMNKSKFPDVGTTINSVGHFTTVLLDINPTQSVNGYPKAWTKYQYTFSGISGKIDTRIAFRHYVINTSNAKAIGIDQFQFQVN